MNTIKQIRTPLLKKAITSLNAGDEVLLSGTIYTVRDQAHLRLSEMIKRRKKLPISLRRQVIYYCGPTPSRDKVIGSCGPTTSSRMDPFTPMLLKRGIKGMIGKGTRSAGISAAIKKAGAVYFLAPAGAGAYLSDKVETCKLAAFKDLGPEAIYKLGVRNFPLIVGIDSKGRDIYAKLKGVK